MSTKSTTTKRMADWLADNPRMLGVLFFLTLLFSQAGNVYAGAGSASGGP